MNGTLLLSLEKTQHGAVKENAGELASAKSAIAALKPNVGVRGAGRQRGGHEEYVRVLADAY